MHVTEEVARMYGTDARALFQEIDPLDEINKRIRQHDVQPRPGEGSRWSSRFSRRT